MAPMTSSSIQVRNSFSDHKFHSRSKAQMCLKKIIDIIISSSSGYSSSSSSLKPCEKILNPESNELKSNQKGEETKRGIDVDLNLRLGPPLEELEVLEVMNEGFSACSVVGEGNKEVCGLVVVGRDDDCNSSSAVCGGFSVALDKSSEGECDDPKEVENSNEVSRGNRKGKELVIDEQEFSEITNLPIRSFAGEQSEIKSAAYEENEAVVEEEVKKFQRKKHKNEGYLDLLVEAARLISGDFEENKPDEEKGNREELKSGVESEEKNGSKRSQRWMLDMYEGFEDISPVVRSKRGRNQVLPYRYRDSVLDPWKRLSRQRSSKNKN